VDGLEQQYGSRLRFVRVDFNSPEGQSLAERYRIRGHPQVLILDRAGAVREVFRGVPDPAAMTRVIDAVLE
jgi:hypothetical protein